MYLPLSILVQPLTYPLDTEDYVITGPNEECLMCPSTVGEEVKEALEDYFQRTQKDDVSAKRGGDLNNDASPEEEESDEKGSDDLDDESYRQMRKRAMVSR